MQRHMDTVPLKVNFIGFKAVYQEVQCTSWIGLDSTGRNDCGPPAAGRGKQHARSARDKVPSGLRERKSGKPEPMPTAAHASQGKQVQARYICCPKMHAASLDIVVRLHSRSCAWSRKSPSQTRLGPDSAITWHNPSFELETEYQKPPAEELQHHREQIGFSHSLRQHCSALPGHAMQLSLPSP